MHRVTVAALLVVSPLLCAVSTAAPKAPAPVKPPSHASAQKEKGPFSEAPIPEKVDSTAPDKALPMPPPPHKSAAWVLEQMSRADNPEIRRRASEAWPLDPEALETLEPLIRQLSDPSAQVRSAAELRLAEYPASTLFSYVMRTFTSLDTQKTAYIEVALPSLPAAAGAYFLETLNTEIELPLHRRIAAYVLGRMQYRTALPELTRHVWSQDAELAGTCVEALRSLHDPQSLDLWIQLLQHDNVYFRPIAIQALAALRSPAALEQIRQLVIHPGNTAAQLSALSVVESYPPEGQLPLLIEILEKNPELAPHAHRMLRKQAGMDLGTQADPWRQWMNTLFTPQPSPLVPSE